MQYTLKLTARHEFPADAGPAIYSDGSCNKRYQDETVDHYKHRLDAWANVNIPDDCTKLFVYMSGMYKLKESLCRVCLDRGITLALLWPSNKGKRKLENGRPLSKKDYKAQFIKWAE